MLQDVQIVTPATSIAGGGASAQLQCQFQTIVVVPGGSVGSDGALFASQFQFQFQIKAWEDESDWIVEDGSVVGVILLELAGVVLPVSGAGETGLAGTSGWAGVGGAGWAAAGAG
jgi:hypothetical protein